MKGITLVGLPPRLRTARLVLEPLTAAHAPELATALDRDRAWLAPRIPLPRDVAELERWLSDLGPAGERARYVLRTLDGSLVGCVGLEPVPQRRAYALSCWLLSPFAGRGFGTEAVGAMCQLALEHSSCDALEIEHARDNAASAALARAVGFVCVHRGEVWRWSASRAELPAWHHVRGLLAAVGRVRYPGDHGTIQVACTDGVVVDGWVVTVDGKPYTSLSIMIADEAMFNPRALLAHGASLAIGAFALEGGVVRVRYGCPPQGLTAASIDLLLHEAVRLRSLVPRRAISLAAFAHAL